MKQIERFDRSVKHGENISDLYYSHYSLSIHQLGNVFMGNIKRSGTEGNWITNDGKPFNGRNTDFATAEDARKALLAEIETIQIHAR